LVLQDLEKALRHQIEGVVTHAWDELIEHAALVEQLVDTVFGRAGLRHPIVARCFASAAQQSEQDYCEYEPTTPLGRFDMDRDQTHVAAHVLAVAQTAFSFPATNM
jgi:hypothetical protein